MTGLIGSVGTKLAIVFLVVAAVFFTLDYIQKDATNSYMQEQKIESIQQEIEIREKVNDILEENFIENPDRDGLIALERLQRKYGTASPD